MANQSRYRKLTDIEQNILSMRGDKGEGSKTDAADRGSEKTVRRVSVSKSSSVLSEKEKSSGRSKAGSAGTSKSGTAKAKKTTKKASIRKPVVDLEQISQPLVFGLDIGTRSIVGTVGYREDSTHFVVVAQVSVEHETRAMLDGQIHDINAVAKTILQVKIKLEDMLGIKLTDVCIAAAGRVLKTVNSTAQITFDQEVVVTNEHIYSLDMLGVENAYEMLRQELHSEDLDFYCVGYSVMHYYQNDYPILNLEGHKAESIRLEMIATFLPDEVVDGLYAAVEKAGLFVANLTLEPIAAINVAIPEKFRLLNLALVDVGAGTSDISITNDGSIIAYGMIPAAGDEVTEFLARNYLLDFGEADQMKCQSSLKKQVTYHDIMGIPHKINSSEIVKAAEPTVRGITKQIADKIRELNGDKSVSAVFVVGGGGKIGGFTETLAEYLGVVAERVAVRGSDVMGNIRFLQKDIKADSLLVTPIGICLNYYEQKNNFIFVTINGERIKLYDNNKLSVVDAALQYGYPNEDLFPKRGETIEFTVNGEKRMRRGEPGEAAIVKVNGKDSDLSEMLTQNDKIEIIASTKGADAKLLVEELPEYRATMKFIFNKKPITCPKFVQVNGELVSRYYEIQQGDRVEVLEYYTLEQVLECMDLVYRGKVYVNNALAGLDTRVYDNFSIACEIKKEEPNYEALIAIYGEGQVPDAVQNGEAEMANRLAAGGGYEEESAGVGEETFDAANSYSDASESEEMTDIPEEDEPEEWEDEPEELENDVENALNETAVVNETVVENSGRSLAEERTEAQAGNLSSAPTAAENQTGNQQSAPTAAEEDTGEKMSEAGKTEEKTKEEPIAPAGKAQPETGVQSGNGRKADAAVSGIHDLPITVNGDPVVLKKKKSYILVDVLDFYPFDLTLAKGQDLETRINGEKAAFTDPLKEGDAVSLIWLPPKR